MNNDTQIYKHCKNCSHLRSSPYTKQRGYYYVCQIKHKSFREFLRLRAKHCDYFKQREEGDKFDYEPRFIPKSK